MNAREAQRVGENEDGVGGPHRADPGQQGGPPSPPVHDQEGDDLGDHARDLDEAGRYDRARRTRDADLLDDRRAVVDDGVDTCDLDQKAKANDEDAGLTETPLEELGEAPLLLVAKVVLDPPDFFFGVHVGFDPTQEVGRLLALAVHQ